MHSVSFICSQKPKSRHEELKERARMLLEQARREAAQQSPSPTTAASWTPEAASEAERNGKLSPEVGVGLPML